MNGGTPEQLWMDLRFAGALQTGFYPYSACLPDRSYLGLLAALPS